MDNGSMVADAGSDVGDAEHDKMNGAAAGSAAPARGRSSVATTAPARGKSTTTAAGRNTDASGILPATAAVIDHALPNGRNAVRDSQGVNHNPRAAGIKVKVAHAKKKSTGDAAVVDAAGPAPAVVDTAHATANASPAAAQTAPAVAPVNGASAAGNGAAANGAPAAVNGASANVASANGAAANTAAGPVNANNTAAGNGAPAASSDEANTPGDFTYSTRARTVIRRSNGGASNGPASPAASPAAATAANTANNNGANNTANSTSNHPTTLAATIAANNENFYGNDIHVEPFAGDDVFAAEFGGALAEGGAGKSVAFAAGSPGKGR